MIPRNQMLLTLTTALNNDIYLINAKYSLNRFSKIFQVKKKSVLCENNWKINYNFQIYFKEKTESAQIKMINAINRLARSSLFL